MFFRGDSKIHAKLFILIIEILTLSLEKLVVRKPSVGGIVIILLFSAGDRAVDLGERWEVGSSSSLPVAGFLTASSAKAAAQTSSSSLEQLSWGPSMLMQCPAHSGCLANICWIDLMWWWNSWKKELLPTEGSSPPSLPVFCRAWGCSVKCHLDKSSSFLYGGSLGLVVHRNILMLV